MAVRCSLASLQPGLPTPCAAARARTLLTRGAAARLSRRTLCVDWRRTLPRPPLSPARLLMASARRLAWLALRFAGEEEPPKDFSARNLDDEHI